MIICKYTVKLHDIKDKRSNLVLRSSITAGMMVVGIGVDKRLFYLILVGFKCRRFQSISTNLIRNFSVSLPARKIPSGNRRWVSRTIPRSRSNKPQKLRSPSIGLFRIQQNLFNFANQQIAYRLHLKKNLPLVAGKNSLKEMRSKMKKQSSFRN